MFSLGVYLAPLAVPRYMRSVILAQRNLLPTAKLVIRFPQRLKMEAMFFFWQVIL